jgi:transketolase
VLADADTSRPDVILIATGSEVSLALKARELLAPRGVRARVVSMPSWEVFEEQQQAYRDTVLPRTVMARVAVEAGATLGWRTYVGDRGVVIGLDHFGASAPAEVLFEKFGFTPEHVVQIAMDLVSRLGVAGR